jgi:hypothetical protein
VRANRHSRRLSGDYSVVVAATLIRIAIIARYCHSRTAEPAPSSRCYRLSLAFRSLQVEPLSVERQLEWSWIAWWNPPRDCICRTAAAAPGSITGKDLNARSTKAAIGRRTHGDGFSSFRATRGFASRFEKISCTCKSSTRIEQREYNLSPRFCVPRMAQPYRSRQGWGKLGQTRIACVPNGADGHLAINGNNSNW